MTQDDPQQPMQTVSEDRSVRPHDANTGAPSPVSLGHGDAAEAPGHDGESVIAGPNGGFKAAIPEPSHGILISGTAPPAQLGGQETAPQMLSRLMKLEEVVRNLIPAQMRRSKSIEDRIDGLQEALMTQVAGIETHYRSAVATIELKLTASMNALRSRVDAAETGRSEAEKRVMEAESEAEHVRAHLDTYRQVWLSAPLTLRLKFIRELLPEDHLLQSVLKESAALEDLRRRGRDLETWLTNYPSLFADAMQSIESGAGNYSSAANPGGAKIEPLEVLAIQSLEEAKSTLSGTLQALGIIWIAPAPGEMVQSEHEVIGEEASQQPEGRIASLRRRGFRVQGRVAMPAQVMRAVATGQNTPREKGVAGEQGVAGAEVGEFGGASGEQRAANSEAGGIAVSQRGASGEFRGAVAANVPNQTDRSDRSDPTDPITFAHASGSAAAPVQAEAPTAPPSGGGQTLSGYPGPAANAAQPVNGIGAAQPSAGSVPSQAEQDQPPKTGAVAQTPTEQVAPAGAEPSPPALPDRQAVPQITPLTVTGEMPDWLRMLVQRTHGCDSQPVLRFVYQIVKLVNLPGQLSQPCTEAAAASALAEALTPLLPLLGLRYADGLTDVDAQWGAILMEVRDPLAAWLREKLQVAVVAPIRGQKFDPHTMEAIETRRTVHESENESVSRVDSVGLIWRDRPLVRARVVRYAIEGAG